MCTVGRDGCSSEDEAEPCNIWNLEWLLAGTGALPREVLQPLLAAEDMGKVALSCHFACGALCAELYDWDVVERG